MELKRILARDTRSAMEQAIQTYGPDVLVISNHQIGAQTELVVAIEVPEADMPTALGSVDASSSVATSSPAAATVPAASSFRQTLDAASQTRSEPSLTVSAEPVSLVAAAPAAVAAPATSAPAMSTAEQDARDYLRSREIVDLVRDEIAALRREFRMRQQSSAWQSNVHFAPAVTPLVQALQEAGMPGALRTLLLDSLSQCSDAQQGLQAMREQLCHHLQRPHAALPAEGLHLLAGPSGAGKTLMTARLAQLGAQAGCEQVAIISYQDVRAGAWSQTQMLASQLGIDAFRAGDAQNLRLLVNELSSRRLVLIDTAGVQMPEHVTQILAQAPTCQAHAVLPADASSATLQRVLGLGLPFRSLLLTKIDEASSPWSLLQFLGDNGLSIAGASCGSRLSDLMQDFSIEHLVDLALAPLTAALDLPVPQQEAQAMAMPKPSVSFMASSAPPDQAHGGSGLSAALDAIAQLPSLPSLPSLPVFLSTAQVLGKSAPKVIRAEPAPIQVSAEAAPVVAKSAIKSVTKASAKTKAAAKPVETPAVEESTSTPTRRKARVSPAAAPEAVQAPAKTSTRSTLSLSTGSARKKAAGVAAHP
jgi:flagellar biosynthesis GTPase FlhF